VLPAVFGFAVSLLLERNLWPRFFFFEAGFAALLFAGAVHLIAARLVPGSPRLATRMAAAALIALAGLSCLMLPKAWYVPKQDFEAARDYVRSHSEDGERVLTVGLAVHPYRW